MQLKIEVGLRELCIKLFPQKIKKMKQNNRKYIIQIKHLTPMVFK